MPFTLEEIRNTINPGAVPEATDLIFGYKSDGSPAAYTLGELTTFFQGASVPQYLTDAANGAFLKLLDDNQIAMADGVIAFPTIVRDSGWYDGSTGFIVPANVTKAQFICQVRTSNTAPVVGIIKNGDLANPVAVATGVGGYAAAVTPELDVATNDTFRAYITNAGNIYQREYTTFSVRTTEKLT